MAEIKIRRTPPTHAFDWLVTLEGTVIEGFESRSKAIEASVGVANEVDIPVVAQQANGKWEPIRQEAQLKDRTSTDSENSRERGKEREMINQ